MKDKTEATWAVIAALLVLFTTMIDPRLSLSAALAILLLVAYAVIKLIRHRKANRQ